MRIVFTFICVAIAAALQIFVFGGKDMSTAAIVVVYGIAVAAAEWMTQSWRKKHGDR